MGYYQENQLMHYGSSKGAEKDKEEESLFKQIMTKTYPKPEKKMHIQIY
jgi:hypothetical protein